MSPAVESVSVIWTLLNVPVTAGVPLSTPAELSERPVGKPVAAQVAVPEPPDFASVVDEYATLTVPAGSVDVVIDSGL